MSRLGVIFDMDGVLIDSYRAHFASWNRMLADHGLAMTPQQFASTFGQTNRAIITRLWPREATERNIADWGDEKEAAFREVLRESFPEMDGAGDLLQTLHAAGFALAVGSSGPRENVETVLNCLPSGHLVTAAVTACDITHSKPHPEVFLTAAEKLGLRPCRCAVIEDAVAGVQAGRNAGMATIALTGTASREDLEPAAHLVVDSLRELSPQNIAALIRRPPGP
jgi:beta-phosphoglucomutase